jgi:alpha-ketoglutarate-dependent taurine dioxygenase
MEGKTSEVGASQAIQEDHLRWKPIKSLDLSRPTAYGDLPAVLVNEDQKVQGFDAMKAFCEQHGASIRQQMAEVGCVLLRGFPVQGPKEFEEVLQGIGLELSDNYIGGLSPRTALTDHVFTSTEAPGDFVITYHNEMCYLKDRPETIAFCCDVAPEVYGETPLFSSAAMLQALSPALRGKLQAAGLKYRRWNPGQRSRINVQKTLEDVFNTSDREKIEEVLARIGATWQWDAKGDLYFDLNVPATVVHPHTQKECLNLILFNRHSHPADTKHFPGRWNRLKLALIHRAIKFKYANKKFFCRTLHADGAEITANEVREIIGAAWKHSIVFKWQKGDVLLLDNILWGHGRLNTRPPRRILAALGKAYSVS